MGLTSSPFGVKGLLLLVIPFHFRNWDGMYGYKQDPVSRENPEMAPGEFLAFVST